MLSLRGMLLPLCLCLGLLGCKQDNPSPKPGKLVITVDDWNVENWSFYIDSFDKYGLKLTFYVSHFHQMNQSKVQLLHALRSRGHEVAYHTLNHPNALDYCRDKGTDQYLAEEIHAGMTMFYSNGINARSFAFPYGEYNEELSDTLSSLFRSVRRKIHGMFEFNEVMNKSYSLSPGDKFYESFGLDKHYGFEKEIWDQLINQVQQGHDVALLFHSIGESSDFSMRLDDFQYMANSIQKNRIECLTASDYFE